MVIWLSSLLLEEPCDMLAAIILQTDNSRFHYQDLRLRNIDIWILWACNACVSVLWVIRYHPSFVEIIRQHTLHPSLKTVVVSGSSFLSPPLRP